jgi:hypothetical protein
MINGDAFGKGGNQITTGSNVIALSGGAVRGTN